MFSYVPDRFPSSVLPPGAVRRNRMAPELKLDVKECANQLPILPNAPLTSHESLMMCHQIDH